MATQGEQYVNSLRSSLPLPPILHLYLPPYQPPSIPPFLPPTLRVLVGLFKKVGEKEFAFLVNSGWYFGFGLGIIQMVCWMFCRASWTLPIGGMIVGLMTNWIALKFIFEPVDPISIGRFTFQGLFLTRQAEVSAEFAKYMSEMVLTSKRLWDTILHGPNSAQFNAILDVRLGRAIISVCSVLGLDRDAVPMDGVCAAVRRRLPDHVGVLHEYTDKTLALEPLMTAQVWCGVT